MSNYRILNGDSLEMLKTLPDESVDCCITSPPYYALRDYGIDGQIGLEDTPEAYIERLVDVFHEVKRVLKNDGTLWVNIADCYAGSGKGAARYPDNAAKYKQGTNKGIIGAIKTTTIKTSGIKHKDLIGIPWMLAFALRADGWYLRQDIIWSKPNPMPESVTDRCTKSHEYIFLLSKSKDYYYDHEAIQEKANPMYPERYKYDFNVGEKESAGGGRPKAAANTAGTKTPHYKNLQYNGQTNHTLYERRADGLPEEQYPVRNKRDVWNVSVKPIHDAHFATYPKDLIEPCVLAGSRSGGTVLDVFSGSGTTGIVALQNERDYIGIELNPEYVNMSKNRIENEVDYTMFNQFGEAKMREI